MHDFQERKAMDEFADNCIYVVENLNFNPEEFGTYEPKEEGEAPAPQAAAPQAAAPQAQPVATPQTASDVQSDVVVEQPTLRAEPAPVQKPNDVSSIVKKWSVKT